MLGVARTALSSVFTPVSYDVFVSPSSLRVRSSNGGTSSPLATTNINGGVGPFTYQWTIQGDDVSISSPTSESTSFSSSGYNEEKQALATVTVTDTGNGSAQEQGSINLNFIFGTLV